MRIAIGSAFRNCEHNVSRYLARIAGLREMLRYDELRIIAAEGDSSDRTRAHLRADAGIMGLDLSFAECSHGQRHFGSTEEPERMEALSRVGNAIFEAVREDDDVLVYVEQDLTWEPHVIRSLISDAVHRRGGFDVFAPLVMAGTCFYDIWGFRKGGERFSPFYPYHRELVHGNGDLTEVDSVGSCLVMPASVARQCRIRNSYCLVGWCEDARNKGYRIGVRTDIAVRQA